MNGFILCILFLVLNTIGAQGKSAHMYLGCSGHGTLSYNGKTVAIFGDTTFTYMSDVTLRPGNAYVEKWSSEYNVPMYYAVGPIHWQRGAYIHSGSLSYSVGCPHLSWSDAVDFYNYVKSGPSVRLTTTTCW
eukprot:543008_1